MEPEATLQEVSVRCYTEKPLFSQWTGQKEDLFCKEEGGICLWYCLI